MAFDLAEIREQAANVRNTVRAWLVLERAEASFKERGRLNLSNQDFAQMLGEGRQAADTLSVLFAQYAGFINADKRRVQAFNRYQQEILEASRREKAANGSG